MTRSGKSSRDGEALWPVRAIWVQSPRPMPPEPAEPTAAPPEQPTPQPQQLRQHQPRHGAPEPKAVATQPNPAAAAQPMEPSLPPDPPPAPVPPTTEALPPEALPPKTPPPRRELWLQLTLVLATVVAGWLVVTKLPALVGQPDPPATTQAPPIDYRHFGSLAGLTMTGTARQDGNRIRLAAGVDQAGAVWSAYPLMVDGPMSAAFRFTATGRSGTLGFVLRKDRTDPAVATPRVTIGLEWTIRAVGQITISAVRADGTSVDLGGVASGVDLGEGPVTVWVDYLSRERVVRVYAAAALTKPGTPTFTTPLDLPSMLGDGTVYAGLTASTADSSGTQDLLAWHTIGGTGG